MNTLRVETREEWRTWLADNHAAVKVVWLVFYKKHTGVSNVPYDETVEEALCFGWIDSLVKKLDDDRYARKYTPRNVGSVWSELNKKRAAKMIREGCMTDVGMRLVQEAKDRGEWERVHRPPSLPDVGMPQELVDALSANATAKAFFDSQPPSYRKCLTLWIGTAKRPDTRERRTREAIETLERGERIGLK